MKYEKLFPIVSLCLFLSSCDDNSNSPEIVGNFYPNIEACRKDYDIKICEDAFNNAINDLKKNSKKFTDIDICQEEKISQYVKIKWNNIPNRVIIVS